VQLASAPVSFGVDEVQADAWRPGPDEILDAMVEIGFAGSELGPPGYLGDPDRARDRLESRNLALVGAFHPLRFSRPEFVDEDLDTLRKALARLADSTPAGSQPKAILADSFDDPQRMALAGRVSQHPEAWLPPARFELLIANLHRAAEICQRAGFDAVLHSHAGTYIETATEIRAVADRLDSSLIGLCLDTGHARLGGADPVELAATYRHLLRHVHIKDCDSAVLAEVTVAGCGLRDALELGVFCELGLGDSAVPEVLKALDRGGYAGWIVVEQDRRLVPGTTTTELIGSQRRNIQYLAEMGIVPQREG
jgi:inosose dehydratase